MIHVCFYQLRIEIELIFIYNLAYLIDTIPSAVNESAPSRVDSILSYLDEANNTEVIVESVRSHKSTAPSSVRSTTRQQPPKKVAQSVAVPQNRSSPPIEQPTKVIKTPHKSLAVPTKQYKQEDEDDEELNYEAERTAHDVTETVLQIRMDNEEKQRQIIILQQRLVNCFSLLLRCLFIYLKFRINNVS